MSTFLAIKKTFDLSASNDTQMLVGRQNFELSSFTPTPGQLYDAQVEYIESTGTQWIDTGIIPTEKTSAQFKVYNKSWSGDVILGYINNSSSFDSEDWRIFNHSNSIYWDLADQRINGSSFAANAWREFEVGNNYVKDLQTSLIVLQGTTVASYTAGGTIKLNYSYYNNIERISQNKWAYVKIYENNVLVRDMIPVRIGQIGYMYDKVSGQLFGNQGSGNFVLGNDITIESSEEESSEEESSEEESSEEPDSSAVLLKKRFDFTVDVTFDSTGGAACPSATYTLGQTYSQLPSPTKSSHVFKGWWTASSGGTAILTNTPVELSNTTLYAHWQYADVGNDYTEYVAQTTSSYKKTGIYSATRYDASQPVVVDWGDGNVEAIEGNISQLAHEYSTVGTFHVKVSNTSNFQPSYNNSTWYNTTSLNRYTFKYIVKTGSHCTSFDAYAFYYCSALSSINFLSSCFTGLTSIPNYSFYYCSGITQLSTLPSRIKTLGAYSFQGCTGLTGTQDLRNTGLTSFYNNYIFANCSNVREYKFPSNIGLYTGTYLFSSNSNLSAFEFPSSLTAIANYTMYSCTGLKHITIPNNIKTIQNYAFRGCINLSSVTYETTALTSIGQYAFYQNYVLRDLNVPDTVKSIGQRAFYYCYNTYASSLTLPSALTSLGTYAYYYCYNLKDVTIPSGLTTIPTYAFSGCRSISSITDYRLTAQTANSNSFGTATGTSYTAYTGYNTRGSNKLRIYSNATGYDSSYWLDPLQNADKCGFSIEYIDVQVQYCAVTLNAGTGSVSPSSLTYAYGSTMSTLPTPTPASGKIFSGWNTSSDETGTTYTTTSTAPNQATLTLYAIYSDIENNKLYLAIQTTSAYKKSGIYLAERDDTTKPIIIDWGDGTVEQVNGDVSQKVHEYSSIGTFNVVVENIKSYAASANNYTWYNTTSQNQQTLKEVISIPNSITSIVDSAFYGCRGLTSVTIPSNITSIGGSAFCDCTGLTSVTIPNSVTNIRNDAFNLCYNLTNIICQGKTISQIQAMNPTDWFGWMESTITITGTDGSFTITISCILKGTDILLADGTTKKIENLTYNDTLKVWDFDEGHLGSAKVCWLTRPGLKNNHYYQLTFDNGTVLKTTGINSNHRIFSVDQSKFTNVSTAKVGDKVFSIDGTLTITDIQYVEEECEYYNVMTSGKINCFANGILTSDRYGNLYPIVDMKYVKDGRTVRPYSEYEAVGIDRYWYDNLRLGENTETVQKSKEYIMKCIGQMLPLPKSN